MEEIQKLTFGYVESNEVKEVIKAITRITYQTKFELAQLKHAQQALTGKIV